MGQKLVRKRERKREERGRFVSLISPRPPEYGEAENSTREKSEWKREGHLNSVGKRGSFGEERVV